jgi:hypothetical protein
MAGVTPCQIQAMRKAGFTEEEIADVIATDKAIDQGEPLFELEKDLEAGAKKARRADRTDTPKKANRERQPNEDKQTLLNALFSAILPMCDTYEVANAEREFLFTYGGTKYKVVLSCPRK